MRSTVNPVVGMVVGTLLVLGGLYMRSQPGDTAGFMGLLFLVVGALGIVANLLLWRGNRH